MRRIEPYDVDLMVTEADPFWRELQKGMNATLRLTDHVFRFTERPIRDRVKYAVVGHINDELS